MPRTPCLCAGKQDYQLKRTIVLFYPSYQPRLWFLGRSGFLRLHFPLTGVLCYTKNINTTHGIAQQPHQGCFLYGILSYSPQNQTDWSKARFLSLLRVRRGATL